MQTIGLVEEETYLSEFLKPLFMEWERYDVKYCILRNYEELPYYTENDIDILVNNVEDATKIILKVTNSCGWSISNIVERTCKAIYIYKWYENKLFTLHIDLFQHITWKNYMVIDGQYILANRVKYNNFYICSIEFELVTKMLSRLIPHGKIKEKYISDIRNKFKFANEEKVKDILSDIFNKRMSLKIINLIKLDNYCSINNIYKKLRWIIKINNFKRGTVCIKSYFKEIKRLFYRILNPKGKMVVFLGTDGSGKTTVINKINTECNSLYHNILVEHWRPNLLARPKISRNVNNENDYSQPHKLKPYGKIVSTLRFLYYNLDYILGYYFKVLPVKIKGGLFIFDRYYFDYYIDKQRYRMNISDTAIRTFERFIPKADILILYSGNIDVIHNRKEELTLNEIREQNDKIMELNKRIKNSVVIDCTQKIDGQVKDTTNAILENIRWLI